MNCQQAQELLIDVLYDELPLAQQRPLRAHLESCPACAGELRALKKTRAVAQALHRSEPPSRLDAPLVREAERMAESRRERPAGAAVLQVFIFRGGELIGTDVFAEPQVIIGRDPGSADLVLESAQVSRQHARLERDGDAVRIRDLGSTNGVFVGKRQVSEAPVTRLDEVLIGEFTLKVKLAGQRQPAAGEPAPLAVDATAAAEPGERPTRVDEGPPVSPAREATDWDDVLSGPVDVRRGAAAAPAPAPAPAPDPEASTAVADDQDEDEEDEDAGYEPPYSLVAQLLQEDAAVAVDPRRGRPHLEVLTFRGDTVVDAALLQPGQSFWIGPALGPLRRLRARDLPPRVRLLKYRKSGECRVEVRERTAGVLKRGAERVELDKLQRTKNARRGTMMMGMRTGEVLDVADGGTRYHVRFVEPPEPLKEAAPAMVRLRPSGLTLKSFGSSIGVHLVSLITIGLLVPKDFTPTTLQANDAFVEVKLEVAPELAPPPEEKPKEEPKQAESEKVPPGMEAKPSRKRPKAGGTSAAPAGVLGLLSKRGSSAAPGPAAAVAAVSNLTAARVPGASSGYRVSGLIGKLPTSSLSVGGGGGGLMTKGGATLLRGGGGGGGLVRGSGTRGVGGLVQKNPGAMRSVGQGTLDRDEIQKVINQNIGQIQRCYERELLKKPGLSGKVQVEWTIATSGKVRSARQTYTSMQSTDVSNCIMGAIRTWVFPQPKGGEVIVNYPFIFKSIGF